MPEEPENIEYYEGVGRKCQHCKCYFGNSHDMKCHEKFHLNEVEEIHWYQSKTDRGLEFVASEKLPYWVWLLSKTPNNEYKRNGYTYKLSGKWITRRKS